MSDRDVLVTVTGDGTLAAPAGEDGTAPTGDDARLPALMRLRALLGDDPEEQIGSRLYLPAALGTERADHLLPSSLALLGGTTGDLVSYGWRVGPGTGSAWRRARELRERTVEDARIALYGYEGPLATTTLGPLTLSAATFLATGERTLSDAGAVRDLPELLAEGVLAEAAALAERVPGAVPGLLVREDAARAVAAGRVPTASGYGRHAPLPAAEMGQRWRGLHEALVGAGLPAERLTLSLPADAGLLAAARTAGWRRLAIAPAGAPSLDSAEGRAVWEGLAEAREAGVDLELVVTPARAERDLDAVAHAWSQLGYPPTAARGFTLVAHAGGPDAAADPALPPGMAALVTPGDLERVLRIAPAWAERLTA